MKTNSKLYSWGALIAVGVISFCLGQASDINTGVPVKNEVGIVETASTINSTVDNSPKEITKSKTFETIPIVEEIKEEKTKSNSNTTNQIVSGSKTTNKQTENKIDTTVYITKTGEKYHRGSCSYLRKSKIEISKSSAINNGYTPCSRCKP